MRAIVHVGMPKTGTSSIQRALQAAPRDRFRYARLANPNHSRAMILLFEDEDRLAEYHGFWPRGPAYLAGLPAERRKLRASFDRQVAQARAEDLPFVISAEDLWGFRHDVVREGLQRALAASGAATEVLGYLRPPLSYAASAFQQRLKNHKPVPELNVARLWPSYPHHMQAIDRAFGAERVQWRLFCRGAIEGGDVVADFARAANLSMPRPEGGWPKSNESLPVEAVAFLYAQRRRGLTFPSGFPEALEQRTELIAVLKGLGRRPMAFAPEAAAQVAAERAEEKQWAEARLGRPLVDDEPDGAVLIRSEADLLALAEEVEAHDAAREFLDRLAEAKVSVPLRSPSAGAMAPRAGVVA